MILHPFIPELAAKLLSLWVSDGKRDIQTLHVCVQIPLLTSGDLSKFHTVKKINTKRLLL